MAEGLKEQIDVYKIRIEEQDRNYYSLRDIEWRMALQFLSGYIAVGAGYHSLRSGTDQPDLLRYWCVCVLILLFVVFSAFRYCLHQRLTFSREMKNVYVKKVHELIPGSLWDAEEEKMNRLVGRKWYAFATQMAAQIIAVITVLAYVISTPK